MEQQLVIPELEKPMNHLEFMELCVAFNEQHKGLMPAIDSALECPVHIHSAKTSYHRVVRALCIAPCAEVLCVQNVVLIM